MPIAHRPLTRRILITLLTVLTVAATATSFLVFRWNAWAAPVVLELDTERDITINGVAVGDRSGYRVASGDVNDDGATDLIVGASHADPEGKILAGQTYVVFGPFEPGTLELSTAADIIINGVNPGDAAGDAVASGDVNGDGVADVIIGADGADPGGRTTAGATYVLFGPLGAGTFDLATDSDITVNGIDVDDHSAAGVASGDVNDDGVDDLVIGAPIGDPGGRTKAGETYVLFGPLAAGTFELSSGADITVNGVDGGDASGIGVAVGDIDDDGSEDLVIGANAAESFAGETYVIFGPLAGGILELSTDADITITGSDPSEESGTGAAVGDVNNDGSPDLAIGAYRATAGGIADAGKTYILLGPLVSGILDLSTDADVIYHSIDSGDVSGSGLAVADFDNDGAVDLVIGAAEADPGGKSGAGETYVIFGEPRY